MTVLALGIGAFRPQVGQLRVDAEKLVYGRRQLAQPRSQGRALLRRQPPRGVGHEILLFVREKGLPPGPVSQFGHQLPVLVFRQFVAHVVHRRIVVGHDTDGFSCISRLATMFRIVCVFPVPGGPSITLTRLPSARCTASFWLALQPKEIDEEGRIVDIARRRPPVQIGIQRRTGILRIGCAASSRRAGRRSNFSSPLREPPLRHSVSVSDSREAGCENLAK